MIKETNKEWFVVKTLAEVMIKFNGDNIKDYDKIVTALAGMGPYSYSLKNLELDLKNRPTSIAKPSIEEPSVSELKVLLDHRCYAFLGENNILHSIIVADLVKW